MTTSKIGSSYLFNATYTIGSPKHIRTIVEVEGLAQTGTRELADLLIGKYSKESLKTLKSESIKLLHSAGCYPAIQKKGGGLYGPKALADKVRDNALTLDSFQASCLRLAVALERMIERDCAPVKQTSPTIADTVQVPDATVTAEPDNAPDAPKLVTSSKLVSPATESAKSKMAALLASILQEVMDLPVSEKVREAMALLPQL